MTIAKRAEKKIASVLRPEPMLAEHIRAMAKLAPGPFRAGLLRLLAAGKVTKTGSRRGTRYSTALAVPVGGDHEA